MDLAKEVEEALRKGGNVVASSRLAQLIAAAAAAGVSLKYILGGYVFGVRYVGAMSIQWGLDGPATRSIRAAPEPRFF